MSFSTIQIRMRQAVPCALLVLAIAAWAGKDFVMPVAQPAKNYPAHDAHIDELVTVGLDPYDQPGKGDLLGEVHRGRLPSYFCGHHQ